MVIYSLICTIIQSFPRYALGRNVIEQNSFIIPLSQFVFLIALKSLQQSKFSQMVLDNKGSATIKNLLNVVCVNSTCVKGFTAVSTVPFGISLCDSFFKLKISFYYFLEKKIYSKISFCSININCFMSKVKKPQKLSDLNNNDKA